MANEQGLSKVPYHLAIIMDGNGRWARQRGLPRLAGHRAGTENIRPILEACVEYGVQMLTIWAFSTENWGRPKREVRGLLRILSETIDRQLPELHANGVRLRHIGRLDRLPRSLQEKVRQAIALTANNERITLNVAFDYGGRAEILQAVRRIIADGIAPEQVDEALFSQYLYTAGLPDPDLVIRTSGEFRTSNFMIWQAAY
ncbi:MAG: di-trans,poly-cis-decaprenylcistransferase, partial [Anaerolineae bacterium]|nr:di-trans,poly-cis-decaprenylcistransferase [Anaerolineae bacterium]